MYVIMHDQTWPSMVNDSLTHFKGSVVDSLKPNKAVSQKLWIDAKSVHLIKNVDLSNPYIIASLLVPYNSEKIALECNPIFLYWNQLYLVESLCILFDWLTTVGLLFSRACYLCRDSESSIIFNDNPMTCTRERWKTNKMFFACSVSQCFKLIELWFVLSKSCYHNSILNDNDNTFELLLINLKHVVFLCAFHSSSVRTQER